MSEIRREASAIFAELTDALSNAGLDFPELGDGFQLTETGAILLRLRPLTLTEITRLTQALNSSADLS
ncbi:hypothetical protein [Kitasatospora kifunensis]|uniref:Uncharacterized protein n=1 Tax=Kitasatospora kifunensis TaxID=58351 RepID=A0A7W7VVA4_KITKI|nr:hypothetical protein [Kitasatospora kifunensis]MBB4923489.1 hypothetical protein [Kitasatospora kifunensis]